MPKTLALLVRNETRTLNRAQLAVFRNELERVLPLVIRAAGQVAREGNERNVNQGLSR